MFVDRLRELESMNKILANSPALFVLYGRRRVGKTELLQHFYRDRPHVYYLGDLSSSSTHVRALSSRIGDHLGDNFLRSQSLSDWRGLLEYLRNRKAELDLVLDEFPYLVEADPTLPSLLQSAWDQGWRDAPALAHQRQTEHRLRAPCAVQHSWAQAYPGRSNPALRA